MVTEPTEPTPRWKCPDCAAWVRDDVEVHKCEKVSYPLTLNGYTCSRCGMFVTFGNFHNCTWTWTQPNPPIYYYTTTAGNSTATIIPFTTTNDTTKDEGDDDGAAGVAVS